MTLHSYFDYIYPLNIEIAERVILHIRQSRHAGCSYTRQTALCLPVNGTHRFSGCDSLLEMQQEQK